MFHEPTNVVLLIRFILQLRLFQQSQSIALCITRKFVNKRVRVCEYSCLSLRLLIALRDVDLERVYTSEALFTL